MLLSLVNSWLRQRKGKMNNVADSDQGRKSAKVIPLQKDELAELKRLLLSQEQTQILEILHRLDDPEARAKEISRILPEAIVQRVSNDGKLVTALMTTVEEILKDSVKRDPSTLVNSLFPVMGPAIRRSVAEFVRGMIQSLNQTLEHGLSIQGLKWRFESFRTGKPFAEVVLLNSLIFRVEQVFLIHKETGLLLSHVTAESAIFQDPDMVSGMLTAIQDFVRDSFQTNQSDGLENLQLGELTVVVEQGPSAYLAAVIRGTLPAELRVVFKETLETIHFEMGPALESFDGDATPFELAAYTLENCFQDRYKTRDKKGFPYFAVISALVLLGVGYWLVGEFREGLRWNTYIDTLKGEKGIVVVDADRRAGKYAVSGLRDPLAIDPGPLVDKSGLEPGEVVERWEEYQAMDPEFVLTRARRILKPPATVTLTLDRGVLSAKGTAPYQWIVNAKMPALLIPGITEYQDSELRVDDSSLLGTARKILEPPDTVTLSIKNGVLTARGKAPVQWIGEARKLARLVPGVTDYRDTELAIDYGPVLERVKKGLEPPDTVKLSIEDGVLTARGMAPYQWIRDARKLAPLVSGIEKYKDSELHVDYDPLLGALKKRLDPPDTVTLQIDKGILKASGRAPHRWIVDTRRIVRGISEISGYHDNDLKDMDQTRFDEIKHRITMTSFSFLRNTDQLNPGEQQGISDLAAQLRSLDSLALLLGKRVSIDVKGHTDSSGSEQRNRSLSDRRAGKIVALLKAQGVRGMNLSTSAVAAKEPLAAEDSEQGKALNRRVGFTVVVEDNPAEGGY
jgi:outer membrane protein OmpA-like peptidoglycan-associated protein